MAATGAIFVKPPLALLGLPPALLNLLGFSPAAASFFVSEVKATSTTVGVCIAAVAQVSALDLPLRPSTFCVCS